MIVYDKMQSGYEYAYDAPEGEDFAPDFCPALSPKQMLQMGVLKVIILMIVVKNFRKIGLRRQKFVWNLQMLKLIYFK